MDQIKLLLLFSGKRKSGKDFISEKLNETLGSEKSEIIRISEPIKKEWSKKHNLDLNQLISDGPYKEKFRKDMIDWSNSVRHQDSGFFCRQAIQNATKDIIIVSDIRRKNDILFFRNKFDKKVKTIRIICSDEERIKRGWQFQLGIDDKESECDLDDVENWDHLIINENSNGDELIQDIIHKFVITT